LLRPRNKWLPLAVAFRRAGTNVVRG
jgi:hypothetical protein